jgi:hypothetical protein
VPVSDATEGARPSLFERHPRWTIAALVGLFTVALDLGFGALFIPSVSKFRLPHSYYHHDLRPNAEGRPEWGYEAEQTIAVDSLGFRDREVREVPLRAERKRIVLMGDSFVEGMYVPWAETFAGRLQEALGARGIDVLDAAVCSYSPKLYYLKTRYLLEQVGLKFDELWVFVDISDAQDEVIYKDFEPLRGGRLWFEVKQRLRLWSFTYNTVSRLIERARGESTYINYQGGVFRFLSDDALRLLHDPQLLQHRGAWTVDPELYRDWGKRGLDLGAENMRKLVELCRAHGIRMTVVVYPWPGQIRAGDLDSVQARFWSRFCDAHQVRFVNLFPAFVPGSSEEAEEVVRRYFRRGDVHWNEAGHELIARELLARMPVQAH